MTEGDIKILVGAAGNEVCKDRAFPPSMEMISEDAIGILETMFSEGGMNNNAECQAQKG